MRHRALKDDAFEVSLSVPGHQSFESLVRCVAQDAAARIDADESLRARIVDGIGEAFSLIVRDAMTECQESVHLRLAELGDALRVWIVERGLPLDAENAARDRRWRHILHCADRAAWHWRGRAGTQLQMTFERSVPQARAKPARASSTESAARAPEQTYRVRRFTSEDAHGVVRCFYAGYGYAYDVPAVYEPRRLCALNASGLYISFVALDEGGEIAGHYALSREKGAPIAEGCGAVVDPRHRGHGLLDLLRSAAEEHARALGLDAYFTEPVTDHAITQIESAKRGAHLTAISLGFSPKSMLARHMHDLTATMQRQSLTLYVKPLRSPQARVAYASQRHREMLLAIYEQLGVPVELREGSAPAGEGSLQVCTLKPSGNATIVVERVGTDTREVALQAAADLAALGSLGVMYAMLPLRDPATPALAAALESQGFFFSGLAPWMMPDGSDGLRLQRLLRPIDTKSLTIAGEFGRRLLAYIDAAAAASASADGARG